MQRQIGFMVIVLLLLTGSLAPVGTARAQDDEMWYWGFRPETGQLVAFTAGGVVNELESPGADPRPTSAWRTGLDTGFAIFNSDEGKVLAQLTPNEVRVLVSLSEWPQWDSMNQPIVWSSDYVVFGPGIISESYVLLALESGEHELLSENYVYSVDFSEDGALLRYWRQILVGSQDKQWQVVERELADGDETIIATLSSVGLVGSDRGERWLYREFDADAEMMRYAWLNSDGSREEILEWSTAEDQRDKAIFLHLFDNYLWATLGRCEVDCPLTFTPLDGGEPLTFVLPSGNGGNMWPLRWLPDGRLAIATDRDEQIWVLAPDGVDSSESMLLGTWSVRFMMMNRGQIDALLSPDGRLGMTVDDPDAPTEFQVRDVVTGELLLSGALELGFSVHYRENAVLVQSVSYSSYSFFYVSLDGIATELPSDLGLLYFDILPGDILLASLTNSNETLSSGVYRYDFAKDEATLLVSGVVPLGLADLR